MSEAPDPRLGLSVTHRRYVPYAHAHYGGNLVDGAYSLGLFGDVATASTTVSGSSSTRAADGPRSGSARATTRAVQRSSRLRRPTRTTSAVASSTSQARTGPRNRTSE